MIMVASSSSAQQDPGCFSTSCTLGITEAEYCKDNPTTPGCPGPPKKEEPRVCCMAMTASCLSCSEGISKREFCSRYRNRRVQGCGRRFMIKVPKIEVPKWFKRSRTSSVDNGYITNSADTAILTDTHGDGDIVIAPYLNAQRNAVADSKVKNDHRFEHEADEWKWGGNNAIIMYGGNQKWYHPRSLAMDDFGDDSAG